jgi:hypothetical protein
MLHHFHALLSELDRQRQHATFARQNPAGLVNAQARRFRCLDLAGFLAAWAGQDLVGGGPVRGAASIGSSARQPSDECRMKIFRKPPNGACLGSNGP